MGTFTKGEQMITFWYYSKGDENGTQCSVVVDGFSDEDARRAAQLLWDTMAKDGYLMASKRP